MIYGLRAATTAKENTSLAIKEAVEELWYSFIELNGFTEDDLVSVICSVTKDLDSCYPASFIRKAGFTNIALLDVTQHQVKEEIPRCIRLLVHARKPGKNLYLRETKKLRPEWKGEI
ncbi:MAG TPA: chorismate mutase [Firmicutes bacterium]|jgi:chorismate mutase|nr:chorismate mutase [Bacillota bacterium]